jgi:hypothetical protein
VKEITPGVWRMGSETETGAELATSRGHIFFWYTREKREYFVPGRFLLPPFYGDDAYLFCIS